MQHQNQQKSVIDQLAESLNTNKNKILVAIREIGRNPTEAQLSWKDAIANHLNNPKNPVLPSSSKPEPAPESFSLDEDELMDWGELEEELGQGAIALAKELGYPEGKIPVTDAMVIKEMLTLETVHESLGEKIVAAEGLEQGFAEQYIQNQREAGYAIADAGNIALATGFFQGKVNGLEQISELNQALHEQILEKIKTDTIKVGTEGKGKPNQVVMNLGKKAMKTQAVSRKKQEVKTQRFNLENIRASAKK
jgi:hypothetical protein